MNKAILVGNLVKDPEVRHTSKDLAITHLNVETLETFKDKTRTEQHKIVSFGKLAEINSGLKTGALVYIEGRSRKNTWEKDRVKRTSTEILASQVIHFGTGTTPGVNKTILIGRLGADPEMRYTNDGLAVAILSLATNEKNNDEFETQWHRILALGKLAEVCERYLGKGKQICIEGRFQTRTWKKENQSFQITEIIASGMEMLGAKKTDTVSPEDRMALQTSGNTYLEDDIPF